MAEKEKTITREWTLMFYFASDNPLAPNIVSQLKAIKSAGFHEDVNVIAQFDPNVPDMPTHIFDVNAVNKIGNIYERFKNLQTAPYKFWKANDPYIRNLVLDRLWNDDDNESPIRKEIIKYIEKRYPNTHYDPPVPSPKRFNKEISRNDNDGPGPKESLQAFLNFCADKYPARHYMLFLLGHGLIVGNDMFLYDENAPSHSLSLRDLGKVLNHFKHRDKGKELELLGFHSCSLSALEVACELEGCVNYMLASQGTEYVGSWPYREILMRMFNDVIWKKAEEDEAQRVKETIEKIFAYILNNSDDFQLAGYSFDLCLCDVRNIAWVTDALRGLSHKLIRGLNLTKVSKDGKEVPDPLITERILLAHWDAQSFWQESYTDLYDFCFCLQRRCEQATTGTREAAALLEKIKNACRRLMYLLEGEAAGNPNGGAAEAGPIARAEFAGPRYQYSHGLSVYFPWSEPANHRFWAKQYPKYKFNLPEEQASGWREFLIEYFKKTRRDPIGDEEDLGSPSLEQELLEKISNYCFAENGPLGNLNVARRSRRGSSKPVGNSGLADGEPKAVGSSGLDDGEPKAVGSSGLDDGEPKAVGSSGLDDGEPKAVGSSGLDDPKPFGSTGMGGACECPSIKNYPSATRGGKRPISRGFFHVLGRATREDQ